MNLVGKGGHVRTVPVPAWGKEAVDRWRDSAKVTAGRIFRAAGPAWDAYQPQSEFTSEHTMCREERGGWHSQNKPVD